MDTNEMQKRMLSETTIEQVSTYVTAAGKTHESLPS
jgi:hypothetical protein